MNRLAVALAADSAVSVSAGRQKKVFNTANKLFMLSVRHPVGVMVYSNGSLMGVPWEVLIKTFRQHLGDMEFDNLEEYAEQLVSFIESQTDLFSAELERTYFLTMVENEFFELSRNIQRALQEEERDLADNADRLAVQRAAVSRVIQDECNEWAERPAYGEKIPEGTGKRLRGVCSGEISTLTLKYFKARGWHASAADTGRLGELTEMLVEKNYIAPSSFSGLVVAGFGRKEFFPVLRRYRIGNIYGGHLKRIGAEMVEISDAQKVHVGVYADSGMAELFLKGISLEALEFVIEHAFEAGNEIARVALENAGVDVTDEMLDKVEADRNQILIDLVDKLQHYRAMSSEFEKALTHIPKDELASVAVSLVNLNSFKKRMSMNVESVGGPVDVAVISKGDGFIWIDRKHYFDADKNPHFVRHHLQSSKPAGQHD